MQKLGLFYRSVCPIFLSTKRTKITSIPPIFHRPLSSLSTFIPTHNLVNIEYVLVKDIHGEGKNPRKIYGAVVVEDYRGHHIVYDRSSNNTESKGPGEYISLTGPSTSIFGEDAFIISVSLWDHDNEIAKGDIVFDPQNRDMEAERFYDKHLEEYVSGKHGSVGVGYSVIREALSATIDIVMINGDKESSTDVYGTIKASYLLGNSGSSTRNLFDKSVNEYVQVSSQQSIPLTRPVFPIPVHYDVTIAVDLWDHDTNNQIAQIARGTVQFTPIIGTQMKNITSEYGQVHVSITCK